MRLDQCRVCWLYTNDQRYRKLWDKDQPYEATRTAPKPCTHYERADRVPVARLIKLGLSTARDYRTCEHPAQPLGEFVCPCQGCGSACPGYTLED